jgi:hypothetical protein
MTDANAEFFALAGEPQGATPGQLQAIAVEARKAAKIELRIKQLETEVKNLKKEHYLIVGKTLTDLMLSSGTSLYVTDDKKVRVEMKSIVSGSLPKAEDRREQALAEVIRAGGEAMIKSEISVTFNKTDHNQALSFFEEVKERELGAVEMTEGIHPQTLCAFVRECLREGAAIDTNKIGVYVAQLAEVKVEED